VKDLMGRIRLATDPELTALWPTSSGAAIRLELLSGETLERVCWYPPGHPRNPESDSMLETKFRRLAESVLSDDEASAVIDAVWRLDAIESIGSFTNLLVGSRHTP
jgi:2-methylcitrate dehydratase